MSNTRTPVPSKPRPLQFQPTPHFRTLGPVIHQQDPSHGRHNRIQARVSPIKPNGVQGGTAGTDNEDDDEPALQPAVCLEGEDEDRDDTDDEGIGLEDEPSSPSLRDPRQPPPKRRRLSAAHEALPADSPNQSLSRGKQAPTFLGVVAAANQRSATPKARPSLSTPRPSAALTPAPLRAPRPTLNSASSHLAQLRTPSAATRPAPTTPYGASTVSGPRVTPRFLPSSASRDTPVSTLSRPVIRLRPATAARTEQEHAAADGDAWSGADGQRRSLIPETPSSREFMPGGLADTVRGWIVGMDGGRAGGGVRRRYDGWVCGIERVAVVTELAGDGTESAGVDGMGREEEVRCLEDSENPEERMLVLIGAPRRPRGSIGDRFRNDGSDLGLQTGPTAQETLRSGSRVKVGQPSWEIGFAAQSERWTVGLDWEVI